MVAADPKLVVYNYHQNWTTIVPLSGCFTFTPSTVTQAAQHDKLPTLWFTGTLDCICWPERANDYYKESPSSCKYLINIVNASHCYFGTPNPISEGGCWAAEVADGCGFDYWRLSVEQQQAVVKLFVAPWLDWTLKGSASSKQVLDSLIKQNQANGNIIASIACNAFI